MITGGSGKNTGDSGVECWLYARHVTSGKSFNHIELYFSHMLNGDKY